MPVTVQHQIAGNQYPASFKIRELHYSLSEKRTIKHSTAMPANGELAFELRGVIFWKRAGRWPAPSDQDQSSLCRTPRI